MLTWQWSLKILWSQPSCPLHICPHAKVEPAVLCSTKSFLQCSCSLSSTSLYAMTYRSLKVFTADVFPSMHVRVGCFFTLSPSCSLVSILAVSAALVSVSHRLAMIHVPCYPFHIILQHFLMWAGSGSFVENLDFSQSLTHWPPGEIQMLLCWTLKGGTRSLVSRLKHSINTKHVWFLFSQTFEYKPSFEEQEKIHRQDYYHVPDTVLSKLF